MIQIIKQNEPNAIQRRFYVFLVSEANGMSPVTGEAGGQPQIAKNGASFNNTSNTLVEIGNGAYYVELTTSEVGSLGWILVRYKSVNTAEYQAMAQIITEEWFRPGGRMV